VNAAPHIGHLYSALLADAHVRFRWGDPVPFFDPWIRIRDGEKIPGSGITIPDYILRELSNNCFGLKMLNFFVNSLLGSSAFFDPWIRIRDGGKIPGSGINIPDHMLREFSNTFFVVKNA
jgi:hypothetical protein